MAYLLVLAALAAACTKAEPTPAPAPSPAPAPAIAPRTVTPPPPAPPPSSSRRATRPRAKLNPAEKLPVHGMVLKSSGLIGYSVITLDVDTATLRRDSERMAEKTTQQRKVSPEEIQELMALGEAAWRETPSGKADYATDSHEVLYVLDGDDAFFLLGNPLYNVGHTDRPAAAAVVKKLYETKL